MSTVVVNVRFENCDVYIGRWNQRFDRSPWANPFYIGTDGKPDEVLAKYEAHVRSKPELMARLPELAGKRLGCWCKEPGALFQPPCHGDVLLKLLEEVGHA